MRPYFERDGVTIYCGDCKEVLPQIPAGSVDLVFTSPPYNMAITSNGPQRPSFKLQSAGAKGGRFAAGYDAHTDALPQAEYDEWQREILMLCWSLLSPTGAIFYNHRPRIENGLTRVPLLGDFGLPLRQIITWDRGTNGIDTRLTHFSTAFEWVLLFAKPGFRLIDFEASAHGNLWRVGLPRNRTGHPAPFPVRLPARAISATSAAVVLDPFAGSGSTLVAAKMLGRTSIGIEKSERYCELAVRRLEATPEPLPRLDLAAEQQRLELTS